MLYKCVTTMVTTICKMYVFYLIVSLQKQLSINLNHWCVHIAQRGSWIHYYKYLPAYKAASNFTTLIVPVKSLSVFPPICFYKLSLKLLMVCVHWISLIALTAVLINDALSLIFGCPVLSGVMNMHTCYYCHS